MLPGKTRPGRAASAPERPGLQDQALSRVCSLDDWRSPELLALMEEIVPGGSPAARAHRKTWEFAMGVLTLERGGALHDEALGLSVAAGHEAIVYYLTNRCRWLIATDLYGSGDFAEGESSGRMLIDPDLFAPYAYRRRRLTVAYMDALDLRFPDASFDFVVSFGSIEHFGGVAEAGAALAEVGRVLKPEGVACITTEIAADGLGDGTDPSFHLFSPETIVRLVDDEPSLDWLGAVDLELPDDDCPLVSLHGEVHTGASDQLYPQVKLQTLTVDGRHRDFRSVSLALRRTDR
jgi:SAM-dependent methyltransferase